jgi:alpha-glucosidase
VLSRAGYAGIQRYAAVWTGDVPSTWSGLAQTLPMLLGLGVSGVPIVGSDIGGYSGHASPELYARWLALGSVSPFARAHVTSGVPGQEPWMFGSEVTDIARARLGDRMRLMPYLYSLAEEAARTGAPILRPLVWEFPGDPAVENLGDQAMLGPSILVAPVVAAGATSREIYLPAGRWYELHSGAIFDGPTTITARVTLAALPMYVREGAIIPTTSDTGELVLEVYPAAAPSAFTLVEDGGRTEITLAGLADGATLTLAPFDRPGPVTVRVHRVDGRVDGVDGATFSHDPDAGVLTAHATTGGTLRFRYDPVIAEPRRSISITFEVRVPADTPASPPIHVATSGNGWQHVALAWVSPGLARGTVVVPRGEWLDYKYTRGSWETVEKWPGCAEANNRYRFGGGPGGTGDVVATWRDRCP